MLKHIYLKVLIAAFFAAGTLQATQVPQEVARKHAKLVFAKKSSQNFATANDIKIKQAYTRMTPSNEPSYHIFNMSPTGFVIISAEDNYNPVIAFSTDSNFNFDNNTQMNVLFSALGNHEMKIEYTRKNDLQPSSQIEAEWSFLNSNTVESLVKTRSMDPDGTVVSPLTTTTWNQGQYYNAWGPKDSDPNSVDGGTYCGCVPVAVSQLIKFHNYPPTGHGDISYVDPTYGELTADFCNTTYNWDNMPDSLSSYNDDVARFIYHVGAATQTNYSTEYTSTFVSRVRHALVHYFKYDEEAEWFFDPGQYFAPVAVDNLNQGRPLILTGVASSNNWSHSWVVDGYGYFLDPQPGQPDEFFHYNFGWGGSNDGWYLDNGATWEPIPFEFGTQIITYYDQRYVIHKVFPSENQCGAPKNFPPQNIFNYRVSTIETNSAYLHMYVTQIGEGEESSFRYRKLGDTDWTFTDANTDGYILVTGMESDTEYEFQARRRCCGGFWSRYSDSMTFTTKADDTGGEACGTLLESNLTTSNVTESSAYIYTSTPYGQVANQFRYRFEGSTLWSFSEVTSSYYRSLSGLAPGTNYEFQVRHQCDAGEWTDFGTTHQFTTAGNVGCSETLDLDLFTSSVSDQNAYIYTSQPYGRVDNQFRYRPTGTSDWTMSSTEDLYYRYLSGLTPGTEYEFQVRHTCQSNVWTDWSFSTTFLTTGGQSSSCDAVNGNRLYNSSITREAAYIYTPQPYGNVANQFRYREVGAADWTNTIVSTLYYRYLRNLKPNTNYEFQVSHECSIGNWSDWSSSQAFLTLMVNGGNGGGSHGMVLPPYESPDFDLALTEPVNIKVYPNPTTDFVKIETAAGFIDQSSIEVYDQNGQLLLDLKPGANNSPQIIAMQDFTPGIYMIKYSNGYDMSIERVIKR